VSRAVSPRALDDARDALAVESIAVMTVRRWGRMEMRRGGLPAVVIIVVLLAVSALEIWRGTATSAQDTGQAKYAVRVPNGLGFSEFKGYERWQTVSISHNDKVMAVILANPVMINAYESGIPGNGKPFPDGSRMAKIHWNPKKLETLPTATVPASLHDVDFMVKDSKRFADSGGWGWGAFKYNAASDTFTPATTADEPPQANDAKCGLACHTIVKTRDYVFTDYGKR
jgi:Cytochrome P460